MEAVRSCGRAGVPVAAHLCHAGLSEADVIGFAERLREAGAERIVALRGDGHELRDDGFRSTPAFVGALAERGFRVSVACYPEVHPLATSPEADLDVLREKAKAGAADAIAQFFFDNARFLRFVRATERAGVRIPIVPGLLPVYAIEKAVKLGEDCGSAVPGWVRSRFRRADDAATAKRVGRELIETQARELGLAGIEHLHVYTLNRAELAEAAAAAWREGLAEYRRTDLRAAA